MKSPQPRHTIGKSPDSRAVVECPRRGCLLAPAFEAVSVRYRRDSAAPIRHGQVPLTTRLQTAIIVHRQLLVR